MPIAPPIPDLFRAAAAPAAPVPIVIPEPIAPPKSGVELRQAPRYRRQSRAQLILWPAGPRVSPIDVEVVDFSATGLGIAHDDPLLIGQMYIVREPWLTSGSSCLYTIVRSDRRPDGRFSIGLHVSNTLVDDLELAEEPLRGPSRLFQFLYFLFALIGTVTVTSMAMIRWLTHH
jgi:hypothetical protein